MLGCMRVTAVLIFQLKNDQSPVARQCAGVGARQTFWNRLLQGFEMNNQCITTVAC